MTGLELILCFVLASVAVVHGFWAFGLWFPMRDETRLVRAVVGASGATRMPGPIPCGMVSVALIVIIILIWMSPSFVRDILLGLAGAVLFVRGCLAWVPLWRKMTPVEPFATLDRFVYGPLCLILGAAIWTVLAF